MPRQEFQELVKCLHVTMSAGFSRINKCMTPTWVSNNEYIHLWYVDSRLVILSSPNLRAQDKVSDYLIVVALGKLFTQYSLHM